MNSCVPAFLSDSPVTEIVRDLSFADYAARSGISQTAMKWFDTDSGGAPAKFRAFLEHPELQPTPSAAMEFGSGYHHFVLKPETFEDYFAVRTREVEENCLAQALASKSKAKGFSTKLKSYEDWKTERAAEGRCVISQKAADKMGAMRDALLANSEIAEEFSFKDAQFEVSAFGPSRTGLNQKLGAASRSFQLKGRFDIWHDGPDLLDLKSARTAHPRQFARQVADLDYDIQAALYLDLARLNGVDKRRFGFLAQDSEWPYLPCIHWIPDDWIKYGRIRYRKILLDIAEAVRTNHWPGYQNGVLEPPSWLQVEIEAIAA